MKYNQKQITEAVEHAELPQVMPLIEVDGEARISSYVRESYQRKEVLALWTLS